MKYITSKKTENPVRKIEKTYSWVLRDPNCDGNIKVMCNNCYCHFAVNDLDKLEKYNYCPNCGTQLDKSLAVKQLNALKEQTKIQMLRDTIDAWPQWKKEAAEFLNQPRRYEPLDFP